jgi:hypothetical protein
MKRGRLLLVCSAALCALSIQVAGCARRVARVDLLPNAASAIEFLTDGETYRDTVVKQLGPLFRTLDDGQVLTYRLDASFQPVAVNFAWRERPGKWDHPWSDTQRYSLVLVFDSRGVLVRHSLVSVR